WTVCTDDGCVPVPRAPERLELLGHRARDSAADAASAAARADAAGLRRAREAPGSERDAHGGLLVARDRQREFRSRGRGRRPAVQPDSLVRSSWPERALPDRAAWTRYVREALTVLLSRSRSRRRPRTVHVHVPDHDCRVTERERERERERVRGRVRVVF